MPRFLQVVLLGMVPCALAQAAAPKALCDDVKALRSKVQECAQNQAYSDAARACSERFEKAVKDASAALTKSLEKLSSPDRQSQSLESAKASYRESLAALRDLAARGRKLSAEVEGYQNEIVLPEDFEAIGDTGFSAEVFLENNPCYHSTRELIAKHAELIGLFAKQLELTEQIAGVLGARSLGRETSLQGGKAAKAPAPARQAPAPLPGRKAKKGQSDITGTEPRPKAPQKP